MERSAIWLCVAGGSALDAQVDVPGPERLSHVVGIVVNPVGLAAADVEVTLNANDKVLYQTKTDKSGEFRLDPIKGQYTLPRRRDRSMPRPSGTSW